MELSGEKIFFESCGGINRYSYSNILAFSSVISVTSVAKNKKR